MAPIRPGASRRLVAVLAALLVAGVLAPPAAVAVQREKVVTGNGAGPDAGTLPGMVALLFAGDPDRANAQFCGGTLLDPTHVLTAGHCADVPFIDVLAGTTSLASGGQRIRVLSRYAHPGFDLGSIFHDVAVLRLAAPVSGVTPITLAGRPPEGEADVAAPGAQGAVYGWGGLNVTDDDGNETGSLPLPDDLRTVGLPIVADGVCDEFAGGFDVYFDGPSEVCAGAGSGFLGTGGDPAADACFGDSGGPLVVPAGGGTVQVGVVSRGPTCGRSPTIYTDVRAYEQFLSFTTALGSARFRDTQGSVHEISIERAAASGVIDGNNGLFRPNDSVSRGAAAKVVALAIGLPVPTGDCPTGFSDTASSVFRCYIKAMVDAGLLRGFSDGTFRPGVNLRRDQAATLLAQALTLPAAGPCEFPDAQSPPHGENICALVAAAVTAGLIDGTYGSRLNVSRGQLATFLVRRAPSLRFAPIEG